MLKNPQPAAKGERDVCVALTHYRDVELAFLHLCFEAPASRDAFMLAYSPL